MGRKKLPYYPIYLDVENRDVHCEAAGVSMSDAVRAGIEQRA